jgi:hypothetical protein
MHITCWKTTATEDTPSIIIIIIIIIIILLTAIWLSPGGSTQSHTIIHSPTQIKIHRTTQLEKKKECGRVRAVPRLKMRVCNTYGFSKAKVVT